MKQFIRRNSKYPQSSTAAQIARQFRCPTHRSHSTLIWHSHLGPLGGPLLAPGPQFAYTCNERLDLLRMSCTGSGIMKQGLREVPLRIGRVTFHLQSHYTVCQHGEWSGVFYVQLVLSGFVYSSCRSRRPEDSSTAETLSSVRQR
jgi:hypothetical protein